MSRIPPSRRPLVLTVAFALFLGAALDAPVLGFAPTPAAAADGDVDEVAKRRAIKGLGKDLKKLARDPRVLKKLDEVAKILDGLAAVPCPEAAVAALHGAPIPDEKTRQRIFTFVEENHDKTLLKPLVAMLQAKEHRRDTELRLLVVHALSVLSDPKSIEPLSELITFDTDEKLVAEVCNALSVFGAAKQEQRRPAVKAMVDLYETTYTYLKSIRPEHRILTKIATTRWRVYGRQMRTALQALTATQLSKPHEFRKWWNTCKKAKDWTKCRVKPRR
ncbi:MAG: hypothetical protein QNJ98_04970 [Planctomycetota bacterium]|nr:hypothetical protein [Planctomycetota bacterium]